LRAILKGEREAFARTLTSKLLTYALGRGLERYDTKTVRLIASRLPARNYRFSSLVLEIVNSLPFQARRPATDVQPEDRVKIANGPGPAEAGRPHPPTTANLPAAASKSSQ
jgi:hypothetical protein